MKIDTAIDILTEMQAAAEGRKAAALGLAISLLEDEQDRHRAQVDEAEQMLRALIDGAERRDRETTWRFLRSKLNLPAEVLDEVEVRLGIPGSRGKAP